MIGAVQDTLAPSLSAQYYPTGIAVGGGSATFQFSVFVNDGWNMVSAPGLHPTNQNVETWWPRRTGTVFGFNGSQYVPETIATPWRRLLDE